MILSFVYPSSHHRTAGVLVLYQLANALARRDHEVHFVHGPSTPHRIDDLDELPPFEFHGNVRHHIVDSLDDPSLPESDVVFLHDPPERLGLPCVIVQGFQMLSRAWERDAYRTRAPKVCVASWLVDVGADFGVPPEQLWHVPLGLQHELFTMHTAPERRERDVAMLTHPHPEKGWKVGLEALEILRSRRADLSGFVFGMNPPAGELPAGVELRLALDHRQLVDQVYNATKVFLQSSRVEGFGYTPVEAMACGSALVTTDNGGSRDYAIHDETALVVPPSDPEALAEAVGTLLDDDDRRVRLARAGERYVRRFDWDTSGAILEARLQSYLAHPAAYRAPPGEAKL